MLPRYPKRIFSLKRTRGIDQNRELERFDASLSLPFGKFGAPFDRVAGTGSRTQRSCYADKSVGQAFQPDVSRESGWKA